MQTFIQIHNRLCYLIRILWDRAMVDILSSVNQYIIFFGSNLVIPGRTILIVEVIYWTLNSDLKHH